MKHNAESFVTKFIDQSERSSKMNKLFLLLLLAIMFYSCLKNTTGSENIEQENEYEIVYVSDKSGSNQLYKFDMKGENEIRLTGAFRMGRVA